MDFSTIPQKDNIFYLTEEQSDFSNAYVKVRKKENRILTDEEIAILPYLKKHEWPLREKSTERFLQYIAAKNKPLHILEIGCGNGWFSHKIAILAKKNKIVGLDVNSQELKQATRVFQKENLYFIYGDIFKIKGTLKQQFDIIVLNSAAQYFPDFKALLNTLLTFLKPEGEVHIIDSPFYKTSEIENAKQNTLTYYTNLGFPEMSKNYHHHEVSKIADFDILYEYKRNIINKILRKKDSPFSWYRLKKNNSKYIYKDNYYINI